MARKYLGEELGIGQDSHVAVGDYAAPNPPRGKVENVTVMEHWDEFIAIGESVHLEYAETALRNKCKIKTEVLGSADQYVKEVKIIHEMVRMTDAGIELQADPRHAEIVF